MSFPAYPLYRDSGVKWLGQVPATWKQVPFWALFRRVKRLGYADEQLLSVYRDYGVIRKADRDDNFNKPSEDLSAYQLVEQGDLAINKMKAWQGSAGVSEHRGIVSPAYFVYKSLHAQSNRFLHYLLRSAEYTAGYLSLSKGIRVNQWDLDPAYHSRMPVLLPSRDEQGAIAAFLDRETAKIDALIEEQRRLIALLKEKRQAVISNAVTKGLDPHAPMKDSGVEWLGKVPAHWHVVSVRRIVSLIEQGWSPECENRPAELEEWGILKAGCANRGLFRASENKALPENLEPKPEYEIRSGDILLSRANGTPELVGSTVCVPEVRERLMLSDKIFRIVLKGAYVPNWFVAVFNSTALRTQILQAISGADGLANNLPQSALKGFWLAEPPVSEQILIAEYVTSETGRIDVLIDDCDISITLLNERRATLISAAVTGKIDVRGSAKLLPFPIDRARARGLVGTEIVERSAHQPTFGRVKFQKIAFLAEGHVGISELAGSYMREAAGPLDRALIDEMESGAGRIAGIAVDQDGGSGTAVSYRLGQQRGAHRQELADWLGSDRTAKLDKLIADFAPLTTKQAEAVATLYSVWHDALSEGVSPTDDEIINGFLNDWHPEKRAKFRANELPEWLGWMRRHGIVPNGSGPKTTTGRLFV